MFFFISSTHILQYSYLIIMGWKNNIGLPYQIIIYRSYSYRSLCSRRMILYLGKVSQVWSPDTLLKTIDLCTWPFITAHSGKQITSELSHIHLISLITSFYMSREKYNLYLYYVSSKNWERGLVGASASSMLREGDWSHVRYMAFPGFPAHPARAWTVPCCQDSFLLSFHDWCFVNAKRLI